MRRSSTVDRLRDEVGGAGGDRRQDRLAIGARGLEDHRDRLERALRLDPLEQLEAVEAGHLPVEQHDVDRRRRGLEPPPGLGAVALRLDGVAVLAEEVLEQLAAAGIVLDHQDARWTDAAADHRLSVRGAAAPAAGRRSLPSLAQGNPPLPRVPGRAVWP